MENKLFFVEVEVSKAIQRNWTDKSFDRWVSRVLLLMLQRFSYNVANRLDAMS